MNDQFEIDLFTLLQETDYFIDENTGEFIITTPTI